MTLPGTRVERASSSSGGVGRRWAGGGPLWQPAGVEISEADGAQAVDRDIDAATRSRLRRTVLLVAGLNLSYFGVEVVVALARTGKVMAAVILLPAVAAAWQAIVKVADPVAPRPVPLMLAAGGAVVVNAACALILLRVRHHGGSMTRAAWLAARNDVAIGAAIIVLNLTAAKEVWEVAEEERLAAKALAGEEID